ncbi:MAG: hypothetical protein ACKVPY_13080 [Paracoccaceae bacterium]
MVTMFGVACVSRISVRCHCRPKSAGYFGSVVAVVSPASLPMLV